MPWKHCLSGENCGGNVWSEITNLSPTSHQMSTTNTPLNSHPENFEEFFENFKSSQNKTSAVSALSRSCKTCHCLYLTEIFLETRFILSEPERSCPTRKHHRWSFINNQLRRESLVRYSVSRLLQTFKYLTLSNRQTQTNSKHKYNYLWSAFWIVFNVPYLTRHPST